MLDANILVDAQLRDIFFELAYEGVVDALWSEPVLEEMARALKGRLHLKPSSVDRLVRAIEEDCFYGRVVEPLGGFESAVPSNVTTPDPDDRHVLGAALEGEADFLVTMDRTGFPPADELSDLGLDLMTPDDALIEVASQVGLDVVGQVVEVCRSRLRRPPLDRETQLVRLRAVCPTLAYQLESLEASKLDGLGDGDDTVVERVVDATDHLTDVLNAGAEASNRYTGQLQAAAVVIQSAAKRGRKARRQAIRETDRRLAQARKELARSKREHRRQREGLWEIARTNTLRWIDLIPLQSGDDLDAAGDYYAALSKSESAARGALDAAVGMLGSLRDIPRDSLSNQQASAIDDLIDQVEKDLESDRRMVDDQQFVLHRLGERLTDVGRKPD